MAEQFPQMLVGAGTVLTTEQVDRAVAAGAKFIVSPGLNPKVVKYCIEKGVPVTPGTANPSDVEQAIELGLEVVKFFPAEAAGGLNMIKSMAAPYTNMKFMPTGGINAKNINSYLAFPKILACGGSWMVKGDLVAAGEFDKITELTKEAVMTMLGFELKHIGINCENEEEAEKTAGTFASLFGFEKKSGNKFCICRKCCRSNEEPIPWSKRTHCSRNKQRRSCSKLSGVSGRRVQYGQCKIQRRKTYSNLLKRRSCRICSTSCTEIKNY